MPDLVWREPNEWQRSDPENDEADHVVASRAPSERPIHVITVYEGRPDRCNHEKDALSTDPCLYTVPDASHDGSIEDGPERTPDTEGCSVDDGEPDVVHGTNSTSQADEDASNAVADPHADPCLPP